MNDYQIANDGTIFHIKEDGSISKLGKIEDDRIVDVTSPTTTTGTSSGKGGLVFFLVVFAIATLVLGILYSQLKSDYDYSLSNSSSWISSLESKISSLEGDLRTAKNERDAAKRELSDFRDNIGRTIPFVISDVEIANTDYDGNIETNYGSTIYSSRTMFLMPRIKYTGFSSGNKTLYVKLFRPNGNMSTGTSSPSGYSYSSSAYIYAGQNTISLSSWGGRDRGHWESGTYRIEIWHNNTCLKSKAFTIY